MTQNCPQCGSLNTASTVFCLQCGTQLPTTQGYQGQGQQQAQLIQTQIKRRAKAPLEPVQMGTLSQSQGGSSPHAFAGRGSLVKHHSWLLFGEGHNASKFRFNIQEILEKRRFQWLKLNDEMMEERGYWSEQRAYMTIERGVATIFIYVAPSGEDLYISRATTVQLSIDPFRVALLILALVEVIVGPSVIASIPNMLTIAALTDQSFVLPIAISIIIGVPLMPTIVVLWAFLIASIKYWWSERDIKVYLRRNFLHDFEVDDVMLLEHTVDEAVQEAAKQLNLDATKISPPPQGYETKRRIRII